MRRKRGYSSEFPVDTSRRVAINVDHVPPAMKRAALAQARREGRSLRVTVLRWIRNWLAGRRPDQDA